MEHAISSGADAYFSNSMDHLSAELERIDLIIQHYLYQIQHLFSESDKYRGLYISERDVSDMLEKPIGEPWWLASVPEGYPQQVNEQIQKLEGKLDKYTLGSTLQGVNLKLENLRQGFNLNQIEVDIILLAVAPEIDSRYETVYAYLQDDITKKYLSVDLILNLLGQTAKGRFDVRSCFTKHSNLYKHKLIDLVEDSSRSLSGLLGKVVKLPLRIVDYLFESESIEEKISNFASLVKPNSAVDDAYLHPFLQESIDKLDAFLKRAPSKSLVYLQGGDGAGKKQLAAQFVAGRSKTLLEVNLTRLEQYKRDELEELLSLVVRELKLKNADLYLSPFDVFMVDEKSDVRKLLYSVLSDFSGLVFFAGKEAWAAKTDLSDKNICYIKIPDLSIQQRASIWKNMLASQCAALTDEEFMYIADRFRFTPGQIGDAIATARQIAAVNSAANNEFGIDELFQACRLNTNRKLATLAKRIVPRYGWDDIVLEEDKRAQLRQLHNTVQYSAQVYGAWGFDQKLSLGKGVSALFTGPPGTGKTMAAEIVAKSLGLELYKIDLSLVVSKYIGETEKNLSRIFYEAETTNAILFFDEADALFGKRTGISNSHDRYANVEVAYLLQKMEEYDGVTILATNLRNNMDDAFVRRLTFIITFPFPEKAERINIWKSIWPSNVPLSDDIDLEYAASNFKLSGANIKNIALSACFLAASEACDVGMRHLLISIKREYEKQGRTCVKADFGEYKHLLEQG